MTTQPERCPRCGGYDRDLPRGDCLGYQRRHKWHDPPPGEGRVGKDGGEVERPLSVAASDRRGISHEGQKPRSDRHPSEPAPPSAKEAFGLQYLNRPLPNTEMSEAQRQLDRLHRHTHRGVSCETFVNDARRAIRALARERYEAGLERAARIARDHLCPTLGNAGERKIHNCMRAVYEAIRALKEKE